MDGKLLKEYNSRLVHIILYVSMGTLLIPIYYALVGKAFYETPGLYIFFSGAFLLYLLKKNEKKYYVFVRHAIVVIGVVLELVLIASSVPEVNKLLFSPVVVFVIFAMVEEKKALWILSGFILFILGYESMNHFKLAPYNLFGYILSTAMLGGLLYMFYHLLHRINDERSHLYNQLSQSNTLLNKTVEEKTASLVKLNHMFEKTEELAQVGGWEWDIKNDRFKGSDTLMEMMGLPAETHLSFSELMAIMHPEDREMVKQELNDAVKNGYYDLVHKVLVDGEVKWMHATANFIKDETGSNIKAEGMVQDITLQKKYQLALEDALYTHELTGLPNRRSLVEYLNALFQEKVDDAALFLIDIDHFREINESYTHILGDTLLLEVAKKLKESITKDFFLAHMGADEFVIILKNIKDQKGVTAVAKELIAMMDQYFELDQDIQVRVTVSIGIVMLADNQLNANRTLQFADSALFRAKQEGRGRYYLYAESLTEHVQKRTQYKNDIYRAFENNEFELYYQPQVDLNTDQIIGAEALIRWHHPVDGLLSPDRFISLFEESELIALIGKWAIEEGAKQCLLWEQKGYALEISINVSSNQLRYQNLTKVIQDALVKFPCKTHHLTLEITESALMENSDALKELFEYLKKKQIKIAIDDFGTGYSSYAHIIEMPVDVLKIDKSFIDLMMQDKNALESVRAIIGMGKAIGYKILAEGVESVEQAALLQKEGCEYYQGFLKGKPMQVAEFEAQFLG
ncbi:MAG: hypothetical protein RL113_1242 [Pseudomonadota bacterium]